MDWLTSSDFGPTTDIWVVISAFQMYFLHFGYFFENRKNSGLTPGQNDDPVTRTWKMTQMTRWPNDPVPCLLFTSQIKYLHCLAKRSLEWYFVIDASKFCKVVKVVCPRPKDRNRKKTFALDCQWELNKYGTVVSLYYSIIVHVYFSQHKIYTVRSHKNVWQQCKTVNQQQWLCTWAVSLLTSHTNVSVEFLPTAT